MTAARQGPLHDLRVVEPAGLGPAPFCAMLLADLGADVIRIDRPGGGVAVAFDALRRGRLSVALDLKRDGGAEVVLRLVEQADALLEGFRLGVMSRFGLGPDVCLARNERLVYGRMTGWEGKTVRRPRGPATTSTTSRSPAPSARSGGGASRRCRRSTSSATSAAAASSSPSGS